MAQPLPFPTSGGWLRQSVPPAWRARGTAPQPGAQVPCQDLRGPEIVCPGRWVSASKGRSHRSNRGGEDMQTTGSISLRLGIYGDYAGSFCLPPQPHRVDSVCFRDSSDLWSLDQGKVGRVESTSPHFSLWGNTVITANISSSLSSRRFLSLHCPCIVSASAPHCETSPEMLQWGSHWNGRLCPWISRYAHQWHLVCLLWSLPKHRIFFFLSGGILIGKVLVL